MSARRWRKKYEGQGMVEYALILILVAFAVFAALALVGPPVVAMLYRVIGSFPA